MTPNLHVASATVLIVVFLAGPASPQAAEPTTPVVTPTALTERWLRERDDIHAELAWHKKSGQGGRPVLLVNQPTGKKGSGTLLSDVVPQLIAERPDDMHALVWPGESTALQVLLRRTRALSERLAAMPKPPASLAGHRKQLDDLARAAGSGDDEGMFLAVCALRRAIALSNPLLTFDRLLFSGHNTDEWIFQYPPDEATTDRHSGLYAAEGLGTEKARVVDLLANAPVTNGAFQGEMLSNANPKWNGEATVYTPALDFDASRIVFAWKARRKGRFNLFLLDLKQNQVCQLTENKNKDRRQHWNDYEPAFLPDGDIVFISERRNCQERCGGTRPGGILHRMKSDGSDVITLSWHETNERFPSIAHDGRIVYTRWDYVDRDFFAAHNLWLCWPDGRDPRAPHGNYRMYFGPRTTDDLKETYPLSVFPMAECGIQAIPGASGHFAAIEAGHHVSHFGNIILIDINQPQQDRRQCRLLWPGMEMAPDSRTIDWLHPHQGANDKRSAYRIHNRIFFDVWPLSEDFHIVSEFDEVLLVDKYKNEVVLLDAHPWIGTELFARWAQPLAARLRPPTLPVMTFQGERRQLAHKPATIAVMNVYNADFTWPEKTTIEALRIVQVLPKPKYPYSQGFNKPRVDFGVDNIGRTVLGTVPVEKDGSAYFVAPIEREIYFQALDASGMAVKSMRSGTYVHPGENLTCLGCHEEPTSAPPLGGQPLALRRAPSPITPEPEGSNPISYYRLVKEPVFDRKCAGCHQQKSKGISFEYWGQPGKKDIPPGPVAKFCTYYSRDSHEGRTDPLLMGAHASILMKYLQPSHHDVQLTAEEKRRVIVWLDANSMLRSDFDPSPEAIVRIKNGEIVAPVHPEGEWDPNNPLGIENTSKR